MAAAQFTACRNFACTKFFRLGQNHETISPTRIIMDMVCYAAPGGSDLQAMVLNAVLGPRITITWLDAVCSILCCRHVHRLRLTVLALLNASVAAHCWTSLSISWGQSAGTLIHFSQLRPSGCGMLINAARVELFWTRYGLSLVIIAHNAHNHIISAISNYTPMKCLW